jgi:hypothetical protein
MFKKMLFVFSFVILMSSSVWPVTIDITDYVKSVNTDWGNGSIRFTVNSHGDNVWYDISKNHPLFNELYTIIISAYLTSSIVQVAIEDNSVGQTIRTVRGVRMWH